MSVAARPGPARRRLGPSRRRCDGCRAAVDEIAARLDEPLRVAFAGRVKAGKSTLLNALVGEELAPTDAGECTRIVTWYRDGHTSRVTLHLRDGDERQTTFSRDDGALTVDLGAGPVDDIERIDVQWPSKRLAGMTLIDTPGLGSVNEDGSAPTRRFLAIDDDARRRPERRRRGDLPDAPPAPVRPRVPGGVPRRVRRLGQPGQHDRRAVESRRGGLLPARSDADRQAHRHALPV